MTTPPEPRVGAGAAIVRDGKILLMRRLREPESGCWGNPGGKIDFGERVEDGIRREIAEELGIRLGALKLLCVTDLILPDAHWLAPTYLALDWTGEPVILEPEKHDALDWFALANLPDNATQTARDAAAACRALGLA